MAAKNDYELFRKVCSEHPEQIRLYSNILDDAYNEFKIKSKKDLLELIVNEELEKRCYHKTEPHTKLADTYIDVYYFELIKIRGYLAVFLCNGNWTIKSFKKNNIQLGDVTKSSQLLETLKRLGLPRNFQVGGPNG